MQIDSVDVTMTDNPVGITGFLVETKRQQYLYRLGCVWYREKGNPNWVEVVGLGVRSWVAEQIEYEFEIPIPAYESNDHARAAVELAMIEPGVL